MHRLTKNSCWSRARRIPSHGLLILGIALLAAPGALAEETAASRKAETAASPTASSFSLPSSLQEGRDPFFPSSTRVVAMVRPAPTPVEGPARLELKGISGTPDRPLAIINNRTMAEGEESSVNTDQGRVKVKCLTIDVVATKVMVMAQGKTQELMLRKGI